MEIETLCHHLLGTEQLIINQIVVENEKISLAVESTARKAICPKCQEVSTAIHSYYLRHPVDLAWAEQNVVFVLKVKRFFCRNNKCPKRTFAEQFPELIAPYARRTNRVSERQQKIGVNTCARIAERLLKFEQIGISDTSVNRILRKLPELAPHPIRVAGVDDWAKRKGQRYGTIIIDLERGQIIDLLADRTSATLAKWLKEHPGIEIVSRDRSQTYAEAISEGAPDALQVADRWHLLKNLSEATFKILQQEYAYIKKQTEQNHRDGQQPKQVETLPAEKEESFSSAENRRQERIQSTQKLRKLGWTQKGIAKHLNIHPKTVHRYLLNPSPISRRRRGERLLDAYKPYILKRWNEGCHNATQLFREIKEQGFTGETTIVRQLVALLRQVSGIPPKVRNHESKPLISDPTKYPPTLRQLTCWIMKRPENREEEDEAILELLSSGDPKIGASIELARSFASIVRQQQTAELDPWLDWAKKSGYRIWQNFAAGLAQDYSAVRSALVLPWSNGPTEGHINRLKNIKRMMYGRGKEDLLRKRVLWQGRWSFT